MIHELTQNMVELSERWLFEQATVVRDCIRKLHHIADKQHVCISDRRHHRVVASSSNDDYHYMVIQDIIDGQLLYQKGLYIPQPTRLTKEAFCCQSIMAHLDDKKTVHRIICDDAVAHALSTLSILPNSMTITVPQRGEKHAILANATRNATMAIHRLSRQKWSKTPHDGQLLVKVKDTLALQHVPSTIMGFDISHLSGTHIVGSSVCFTDGVPDKRRYRHFMVRSVKGQSHDPASIKEIVERHLKRLVVDHEVLPQLLLIDGGPTQLQSAIKAVQSVSGLHHIDVISLAKSFEKIFVLPTKPPIQLTPYNPIRQLLQRIRDESHRFALKLQRKKRTISEKTILANIPGLGPNRINTLFKVFRTIENIASASPDDIATKAKLSDKLSRRILLEVKSP